MDFGSFGRGGEDRFDEADEFVPAHLPEPGPFLERHDVLTGDDHVATHRLAHDVFEARGVYDATFGYNLARLDRDRDHPDAGFRYAVERSASDESSVADAPDASVDRALRAEFTPTTGFCPAGDSLAVAAFRAFNGESERHDYDLVRVRIDRSHQAAEAVNRRLTALEARVAETGVVPRADGVGADESGAGGVPTERGGEDRPG